MSIKMSISGIEKELKRVSKDVAERRKVVHRSTVNKMVDELELVTPIDTGLARTSWKTAEGPESISVENTVEYIQHLNEGSSKQAPARFIETTALKYGVPLGIIVEVKQG